jgi:nucleotide-binding universal stress UspA family protein
VASDGSRESAAASRLAASVAGPSHAVVRVVHVWKLDLRHHHGAADAAAWVQAQRLVDEAVREFRALGIIADGVLGHSDGSHVGAAIAEAARQFGADLIVVGSRGLSRWRSLLAQSVSGDLLTRVDCPVLIVRESGASVLHEPSRVLLALAGGDDVAPGASAAAAAASTPGSKVLVAHVAQAYFGVEGAASYVERDEDIQETLHAAFAMLREAGVHADARALPSGPVAHAIAALAWEWNADVIVTGCGRTSGLAAAVFGSVTRDLLRETDRPILVAERSLA